MSRLAAIVPSLGVSPWQAELLRTLRADLAACGGDATLVWVHQGGAPPPELAGHERLVRLPRAAGFAAAVNAGYARLDGDLDLVAVVNDDVVLEPGWLGTLAAELRRSPELAAVQGSNLDLADPGRADGCGLGWNRDWQAVQVGHGTPPPAPTEPAQEVFGVSATAAVYRTAALRAVARAHAPFFDERLESYYEDVELAVRLRGAGLASRSLPAARARHAGQATAGRSSQRRWFLLARNRRWVAASLLGERFAAERRRIAAPDRREIARRLLAGELAAAAGILAGVRAARAPSPLAAAPAAALAAAERLGVGWPR